MEQGEYRNFSNKYLDDIRVNYMLPVFSQITEKYNVGKKILDVGCGNGLFGSYFKNEETSITGVDASEYALKGARDRGYDQLEQVTDFCSDRLPFEDGEFDFVICKDVFEHLLEPEFLLKEISRVVKKDGHVFVNVPNHFPIVYRAKFLLTGDLDTQNFFTDSKEWNFPHIRYFSYKGFRDFCSLEELEFVGDFCRFFPAYIPKTRFIYPLRKLQEDFAQKYPSQFALAYPVLLKKR